MAGTSGGGPGATEPCDIPKTGVFHLKGGASVLGGFRTTRLTCVSDLLINREHDEKRASTGLLIQKGVATGVGDKPLRRCSASRNETAGSLDKVCSRPERLSALGNSQVGRSAAKVSSRISDLSALAGGLGTTPRGPLCLVGGGGCPDFSFPSVRGLP